MSFNAVLIWYGCNAWFIRTDRIIRTFKQSDSKTLASGNRVLNLLEEEPVVEDVTDGAAAADGVRLRQKHRLYLQRTDASCSFRIFRQNLSRTVFLCNWQRVWWKVTLLKLMMRFYETDGGAITYGGKNVNEINTEALRRHISHSVTQETFLFQDTIENNIKVAKADATREEVCAAAKKAAIHEFIEIPAKRMIQSFQNLAIHSPAGNGQRIGIARAFLHDCPVIFLDERTSNDSLNESIILKSLYTEKQGKQILLVSHRKSTMAIADTVIEMN